MQTQKFQRKPFLVDCVQVTEENMEEVAKWCGGTIVKTDPSIAEKLKKPIQTWIHVETQQPMNDRQKQAFVGDWILYANRGYKIYTPKAFERVFEPVFKEPHKDETGGTRREIKIHVDEKKPTPEALAHTRPSPGRQETMVTQRDIVTEAGDTVKVTVEQLKAAGIEVVQ